MISPEPLPQPFIPLTSPHVSLEKVGGKALNLSILARANFPVPNGFFIPTSVYDDFIEHNSLAERIRQTLADLDATSPEALSAASKEIETQFEMGSVPQGFESTLEIAWRWLGAHPVAVRSSATAEDLPDLSFAGQQDTFLNVIGVDALVESVVRCWASLWTARAIGYRARNGISHEDVSLCVVVQIMVQSEASGVLFTANPLTGKRDETVIDATLGLGEALVGGHVEPDHYVIQVIANEGTLAQESGAGGQSPSDTEGIASTLIGPRNDKFVITHKFQGSKALIISGNSDGGVSTKKVDSSQKQAIPDDVILQLAEMGQEIQSLYNYPQDIEWAWLPPSASLPREDGSLYMLQARPITSLFPMPEGLPPAPLKFLIGLHVVQGVLEPFTPLGQEALMLVLTGGGRLFGLEHTLESQTAFYTAAERIWINMTAILRTPQGHKFYPKVIQSIDSGVALAAAQLVKDPRMAPIKKKPSLLTIWRVARFALPLIGQVLRALRNPERRARQVLGMLDEKVAEVQSRQATSGDLWADYAQHVKLFHEAEYLFSDLVIPKCLPPVVAGMMPFFGILERFSQEVAEATGDPRFKTIHMEISRGLPNNVTTEMDLKLWQTAQALREDSHSLEIFKGQTAPDLAASFLTGTLPQKTQAIVGDFLREYGVRGLGEIDMGRIRWREDPTPVMQVLQSYLQIDDPDQAPDAVFARGTKAAEAAAETLITAVRQLPGGWLKARLVRFGVHRYRAIAGLREAPKFFAIRMMGMMRVGLLVSGESLVKAGLLEKPDDLFFLRIRELDQIAELKSISSEIQSSILRRRTLRAREMQRKQIPRALLSDGTTFYAGVATPDDGSNALIGTPVSPGVVEGTVRVVFNPHETQLEPGEILVCHGTDPAWTPLFLAAGGLVMEVGGMMTHGSVVAREYGIPAVVCVDQATTRLNTGDQVSVDGSSGLIVRINNDHRH